MDVPAWHALEGTDVLDRVGSSPDGLTQDLATRRLAEVGPNRLPQRRGRSAWRRGIDQFANVLMLILVATSGITLAMGHLTDALVIAAVVVINAAIGFIQEGRAERSLEAIRGLLTDDCLVTRDGRRRSLATADLVPGDHVHLQSGDRVPADLRLIQARGLRVEEAALTGESLAVSKTTDAVTPSAPIGDRRGMAFSGTFVASGQATGVVVATGSGTELGRIQHLLAAVPVLRTPLLEEVDRFARLVSIAVGVLAVAALAVGIFGHGIPLGEMFLIAVAMAVAAIPEGLPAILSITLAVGVRRMAGRRAIIRRLPAVDTLGAVDVICSDKTGTLTCNEMMIADLVLPDGRSVVVEGEGYVPTGRMTVDGAAPDAPTQARIHALARCGLLCSDARLDHRDGAWMPVGDAIEAALVSLALKTGLTAEAEHKDLPRADAIPFESEHRFMATLHRDHRGGAVVYLKGAPEVVLARCRDVDVAWTARVDRLGSRGRRVLGLAAKRLDALPGELTFADVATGFDLLGLVGAIDPPRGEARAAIGECHAAGIRVAMITGDHAVTARAIAADLGLRADRALTGSDLDHLDAAALHREVATCEVFARVSPEHKLRIVEAFQSDGRTIAMTGDGVNDAPALKRAHIGVAMGRKGTEAAKEAADMVLTDDDFSSIVAAVREGRTVYENLRKSILFIMPTSVGEALVLLATLIVGIATPLTPVQILWVNLVTAVTLALALAFEPGERDLMRRPPRSSRSRLLDHHFLWRIGVVSILMCAGTFAVFLLEQARGSDLATARTAAVNMLVAFETIYLFNTRSVHGPALGPNRPPPNPWAWASVAGIAVLQALYTYLPLSQTWFGTAPIDAVAWATILGLSAVLFLTIEAEKAFTRLRRSVP